MTQEKIDSIRERMCDDYCKWHGMPVQRVLYDICKACPLNELEEEETLEAEEISENPLAWTDGYEAWQDGYF